MFFTKNKEKAGGRLYAFSVKIWQPINTDFIYATDHEKRCCQNSRLYLVYCLVNTCPEIMIFAKNEKKLGVYRKYSLLESSNIFTLTAYMPLSMKLGVVEIRDLVLVHFKLFCPKNKNHDFCHI